MLETFSVSPNGHISLDFEFWQAITFGLAWFIVRTIMQLEIQEVFKKYVLPKFQPKEVNLMNEFQQALSSLTRRLHLSFEGILLYLMLGFDFLNNLLSALGQIHLDQTASNVAVVLSVIILVVRQTVKLLGVLITALKAFTAGSSEASASVTVVQPEATQPVEKEVVFAASESVNEPPIGRFAPSDAVVN